jgi:tetratricopeptide (TPR) repeat protein
VFELGKKDGILNEISINQLGYQYFGKNNNELALIVFKFNVKAYPEAFNTYDSLGEAFMKLDNIEHAILNYEKSLELNPNNKNAVRMLEKLRTN